jgi:tripartite ATP-independent transporter DctP family solute receptor
MKSKIKKFFLLLILVSFAFSIVLTGCGKQEARKEDEQKVVFPNAEGPGYEVDLQNMVAKWIEERTGGAITFEHAIGGSLGGDKDVTEQIEQGILKIGRTGGYPSSMYLAQWMPMNIPFLFESPDQVQKFINEFRDEINKEAAKHNLYILAWTMRSPRQITSNVPIYGPKDLKGLKIRLPEFPAWIDVWKKLGVIPTPMAFTEVYQALEKKVIDAQENPIPTIYSAKFHEVQKYLVLSKHMYWISDWAVNLDWLMSLPEEQREAIKEAFLELEKRSVELAPQYEEKILKILEEKMEVIKPDAKAIREAAMPAVKEAVNKYLRSEVRDWLVREGIIK